MPAPKKPAVRKPRSKSRVDGDGQSSTVAKSAQHRGTAAAVPLSDGLFEITAQASELVPVAQYANVTIGPIAVRRVVACADMDELKEKITEVQEVIYDVIAEDREMVEESVRLHNQKVAEEEKSASKGRGK